jgi:hypothetical protein
MAFGTSPSRRLQRLTLLMSAMMFAGRFARLPCLVIVLTAVGISPATAETPRVPPAARFILHQERAVERFVVQQWVSEASPDVSASGFCVCITVVYDGNRQILRLGHDDGILGIASSGSDITGDGRAELVVTKNSGGAHCCESTTIYSIEAAPREILSVSTGNCPGSLVDLDNDGVAEFQTCDDTFAYAFCSFAFSPMPTVVFAYDKVQRAYRVATPRYVEAVQQVQASAAAARKAMEENPGDVDIRRCRALAPALSLIYAGRVNEGLALFRMLYTRPDAPQVEQKTMELVKKSPLWIAQ